jgi:hypothetical protein
VMEQTDSLTVLATWLQDLLSDPAWMSANGIAVVMYGDQEKIPQVPLLCVEPSEKARDIVGAPRRAEQVFEIFILIYFGGLQDTQLTRQQTDQIAEATETRIHQDNTCAGLVYESHVSRITSGVANKGGSLMRATRITFHAKSRVQLPMTGV